MLCAAIEGAEQAGSKLGLGSPGGGGRLHGKVNSWHRGGEGAKVCMVITQA